MACPLAWVPKDPSCTSNSICLASFAFTDQSNTISWFLLYKTFPLKRKLIANQRNVLLSLSEASGGYSLLSDPNFIRGLPFTDILILGSRITILSASYSAKQGITQYFDQEYKRIPRKGAKGSFFGFFWTLARPG